MPRRARARRLREHGAADHRARPLRLRERGVGVLEEADAAEPPQGALLRRAGVHGRRLGDQLVLGRGRAAPRRPDRAGGPRGRHLFQHRRDRALRRPADDQLQPAVGRQVRPQPDDAAARDGGAQSPPGRLRGRHGDAHLREHHQRPGQRLRRRGQRAAGRPAVPRVPGRAARGPGGGRGGHAREDGQGQADGGDVRATRRARRQRSRRMLPRRGRSMRLMR